jgi:hypothetical protein
MPLPGGAHVSQTQGSTITSNERPWEYFQVLSAVQSPLMSLYGTRVI